MNDSGKRWLLLLVPLSLGSLSVEYDIIQIGQVGLNLGLLTIDDVRTQPLVFTSIVLLTLLVALVKHMLSIAPMAIEAYQDGYRAAPRLVKVVACAIENIVGTSQFGAPLRSFRAGLRKQNIDCGRFTMRGGRLSEPVVVVVPAGVHLLALSRGVRCALKPNLLFSAHVPVALALWAIGAVVV